MGWKQREAARKCGLSPSAIDWIVGHPEGEPKASTIEKIAKAANVSALWIQRGIGTIDDPWTPPPTDDQTAAENPRSGGSPARSTKPSTTPTIQPPRISAARQDLIDSLSKAVGELSRAGDMAGARIASETLARLFAADAAQLAPHESRDVQVESGVAKKTA